MVREMKNGDLYERVDRYTKWLAAEGRSEGTINKYRHDLLLFLDWLGGRKADRASAMAWQKELAQGKRAGTVNGMTAPLNGFLKFLGRRNGKIPYLKVQRRIFREERRELSRGEYERLIRAARATGNRRLELALECMAAMGIRVSELNFITVESAKQGRVEIRLKGKVRVILLPDLVRKRILKYAKRCGLASGRIFLTSRGTPLSRKQIWSEMKRLCKLARVAPTKVFPHNLRHLFARTFYNKTQDIVKLADILGHSSIETTRIYLISTGEEHVRVLNELGLSLK